MIESILDNKDNYCIIEYYDNYYNEKSIVNSESIEDEIDLKKEKKPQQCFNMIESILDNKDNYCIFLMYKFLKLK